MTKQKAAMGRTIRCPRCKYDNLAIDIWCERCGTPVDWQGTSSTGAGEATSGRKQAANGSRHLGGFAALAGGWPWLKSSPAKGAPAATTPTAATPASPAPAAAAAAAVTPAAASPAAATPAAATPAVPAPAAARPPAPQKEIVTAPVPVAAAAKALPKESEINAAPVATSPTAAPVSSSTARVFCPGCGQSNEATNQFCPRCGHAIAATGRGVGRAVRSKAQARPARRPRQPVKLPRFQLPRLTMPGLSLPRMAVPRMALPRIPTMAWAIAAVVLVLLIAPLAYVLSPAAHRATAAGTSPRPALTRTGSSPAAASSALAAAIPGVEAKTGLKYSSGSCPSNAPCLRLAGQTTGLNAAAIQFSTAGTGGRQCAGYVYQEGASWHFVNASCGLPGQVSPMLGSQATVNVPGQCANVRDAAGLHGSIIVCLNDATSVKVDGGPNWVDGKLWWHLEKNGWMAHEFLVKG